jgi:hypothetical protein
MADRSPRRPRYDAYATPLPELTEARHQDLSARPQNQQMLALMHQRLEDAVRPLLRRGTFAEVTIRVKISDGTMQRSIREGMDREHRHEPEET